MIRTRTLKTIRMWAICKLFWLLLTSRIGCVAPHNILINQTRRMFLKWHAKKWCSEINSRNSDSEKQLCNRWVDRKTHLNSTSSIFTESNDRYDINDMWKHQNWYATQNSMLADLHERPTDKYLTVMLLLSRILFWCHFRQMYVKMNSFQLARNRKCLLAVTHFDTIIMHIFVDEWIFIGMLTVSWIWCKRRLFKWARRV